MNDIGQFLDGSAPEGLGGQIPPRLLELIAPGFDGYPFVGLRPFEVEDGPFFFGRREQTHELLQRLHRTRFVAVVGSSGCGKSSLVRAGLIPALKAGFLVADRDVWDVLTMKPGDRPLRNLAAELLSADDGGLEELTEKIRQFRVNAVLERLQPALEENKNVLLIVDQFEETFRFGLGGDEDSLDEAAIFTAVLLALSQKPGLPIYVVLTMRSDFMADCDIFPGFAEAMNRSIYLVPRLTRQQRREAIEGPIRMSGTTIAPRLLDRLLNESDMASDQLPVLQHALMRTWEEWRKDNADFADGQPSENGRKSPILMEHYERAGTLSHALDKHAEEALEGLDRPLTRKIFQALTDVDSANRQVRRSAKLSVLERVTGAPRQIIIGILERFRSDGRSFVVWSENPENGDPLADLSHESLIRRWGTLTQWVRKEAESTSLYRRLEESTARNLENREGLWIDPQLQQALDWKEEHGIDESWEAWAARVRPSELFRTTSLERPRLKQVLAFLERSRVERDEERERREELLNEQRLAANRKRWENKLKAAVVVACSLALVAAGFAYAANTTRSELQNVALASKLVRQSREIAATDPQRSLLLAAEAYALESKEARRLREAENVLHSALMWIGGQGLGGHLRGIHSLDVTPDGRWLVSGARDGTVRLWDLSMDRPEKVANWLAERRGAVDSENGPEGDPMTYVAAARGQRIAFGGADGFVRLRGSNEPLSPGGGTITALAFSEDGRWLAAGGREGELRLWNLDQNSRAGISLPKIHKGEIFMAEVSRNGRWLVTASSENQRAGQMVLWALAPGLRPRVASPVEWVSTIDLSGDDRLALGGGDGVIRLWRLAAGTSEEVWRGRYLPGAAGASPPIGVPIRAVAIDPASDRLVVAAEDETISLWQNGRKQSDVAGPTERGRVTDLQVSPDGRWLVAVYNSGPVRLWSPGDWIPEHSQLLLGHSGQVKKVSFSPDSRWLFTGGSDGTVRRWDLTAPDPSSAAVLHRGGPSDLRLIAMSPDRRWLFLSGEKETEICDLKESGRHQRIPASFASVKISDDGRWMVTGSDGPPHQRSFQIHDLGGRGRPPIPVISDVVSAVDVSSDRAESWVVTGHANGAVRVWQLLSGRMAERPLRELSGGGAFENPVEKVLLKDRNAVVAMRASGEVHVWRLKGKDRPVAVGQARNAPLVFSSDNRWLAGVDAPRNVAWIVDLTAPALLSSRREVQSSCSITQIALDRSGSVFLGCDDGTVNFYVSGESTSKRSFAGHRSAITSLALNRDDNLLVAGGSDGSTRVWSLGAHAEPAILPGSGSAVVQGVFEQDNRALLTVSVDGMVRRWSLAEDLLLPEVERTVGRNLSRKEWCRSFSETPLIPAHGYRLTFQNLPQLWRPGAMCTD